MQTSLLCRLQKKSLEHNDCLYVASVSEQIVRNITFKQIVEVLFQYS